MENSKLLTELFLQRLDTDIEKVASESGAYVRSKLREAAFSRKIINPVYVTKADLQRSTLHDQLVKLVDIEPDSSALAMTFRGQPDVTYVEGDRFEISFYSISSNEFQKVEEELLAYEMPITEIIERNSVKDIQKIEDTGFMTMINAAITTSGKSTTYSPAVSGTIEMGAFVKLFNLLEDSNTGANPLKTQLLLMNQNDFNKLSVLPATQIGSPLASEYTVNGYKYASILGKQVVVTNKGDLVPEKTIYAFPSQEFMGKFYILNDTKFWVEKKRNLIKWSAYESIGMGMGNSKAAAKITLDK